MLETPTPPLAETRRPHSGRLSPAALLHESDEQLVALARSGSERAWTEIMRRYGRQLRAYCARFVGPSRAEDAVQQAYLQAFLALRDGSRRDIVLRPWLYRIAHNCAIDVLRKGSPEYEQLDLEYDGVAQPPALFEQKEEIRGLITQMRGLPEAQRQALALRELEGRSYEEISAQLGHSGSGVRQLIFRARTALRNGVTALVPFSFLRKTMPVDGHHIATAAAVSGPASSSGGLDALGAATLAVVAVLGGGFVSSDRSARHGSRHDHHANVSPTAGLSLTSPPSTSAAPSAAMQHEPTAAAGTRTPKAAELDLNGPGAPASPPVAPITPPAGPPPAPGTDEASAAPPAPAAPAGVDGTVSQQVATPQQPVATRMDAVTGLPAPAPKPAPKPSAAPIDGVVPVKQPPATKKPAPVAPPKPLPAKSQPQPMKAQPPKPPAKTQAPKGPPAKPKSPVGKGGPR